jgi:hypothetical protein
MPNELRGKRYLMKLDFLIDDTPYEQFSYWLNTIAELNQPQPPTSTVANPAQTPTSGNSSSQ